MTQFDPILNSLFLLPSFLFHPLLSCYRQLPQPYATSSCPKMSYQHSLHIMGLNKYQKDDFATSTFAFYQKSIFNFLNPFANISGYLNF